MPNLSLFCVETEIHPAGREPKKLYNAITKKSFGFALVPFLYCVLVITLVDTVFNEWHEDE